MIIALITITSINLLLWILIFSNFSFHKNRSKNYKKEISSSIVIPIRNEQQNIEKNLNSIINQKYLKYDIIIVDDNSVDDSFKIAEKLSKNFEHLKIFKNEYKQGKKYALNYGVSKSNSDIILFTDADCYTKSNNWLAGMLAAFENNTQIVLGYSPYVGKGLLNIFIRFETFITALQYFSYYLIGIPYMGVGRNMAIRKDFFSSNNVYKSHLNLKSGSDDLLVNEFSDTHNTKIQIDPNTFVYTEPPESLPKFIKQKTRHISTSFRYKWKHKILLSVYSFSHISWYLSLIVAFFVLPIKIVFYLWLIRMIVVYLTSFLSFIKLKEKDLLPFLPLLDLLMFFYYLFIGFYYFFAQKNKW